MRKFRAEIIVCLKESVLDPQGAACARALRRLNFSSFSGVRQGRYFELKIEAKTQDDAHSIVSNMCHDLLSNPVIETYRIALFELSDKADE